MKEQPAKFKISDFFTKESSEKGTKLPLTLPDGSDTGEYLIIVGNESDTFRRAKSAAERAALELSRIKDDSERDDAVYAETIKVLARCVVGWSLDEECNFDSVCTLLTNAPYIKKQVDIAVGNRALFFAKS